MNKFEIFVNVSDKEMCEIYKDIVESKEAGLRPRNLDSYAKQIKEICRFEMFSEATDFVIELFYEEIAIRYFKAYSRRVIEAEELRKIMEQDDMLETVSKNDLKINWILSGKRLYLHGYLNTKMRMYCFMMPGMDIMNLWKNWVTSPNCILIQTIALTGNIII